MYLVNVHVPRTWEGYDNDLFARVAPEYPNVHVLDWTALATANRPLALRATTSTCDPAAGATGYADWLAGLDPAVGPGQSRRIRTTARSSSSRARTPARTCAARPPPGDEHPVRDAHQPVDALVEVAAAPPSMTPSV